MARRFINRVDLLDSLQNSELIERYRLDRQGILFLNDKLTPFIGPTSFRNNSLNSIEKILIALRYFATSSIQLNDGDIHEVSQPTVSRVISQVTQALTEPEIVRQFISVPTAPGEIRQIKEDFFNIARFPNVIGVIDGTHVQIQAPVVDEPAYVNRMGYHSINTQVILFLYYIFNYCKNCYIIYYILRVC